MGMAGKYKVSRDFSLLGQPERIVNKNNPAERGLCTGQRRKRPVCSLAARARKIHPGKQQPAPIFLYHNVLILQQLYSTTAYDIVHKRYIRPVIMIPVHSIGRCECRRQCHVIIQAVHGGAVFRQVSSKEDGIYFPFHRTQQLGWKAAPVNV
ncbi:hypothetical protein D3C75_980190 [compost metagenome]